MLVSDEQPLNIFKQLVTDGSDGSVTLCKDEQFLNILWQLVTDGSDGSLASISATHTLNKYVTSVTESKFKCDKSAHLNARHI